MEVIMERLHNDGAEFMGVFWRYDFGFYVAAEIRSALRAQDKIE